MLRARLAGHEGHMAGKAAPASGNLRARLVEIGFQDVQMVKQARPKWQHRRIMRVELQCVELWRSRVSKRSHRGTVEPANMEGLEIPKCVLYSVNALHFVYARCMLAKLRDSRIANWC